MVAGTHRDRKQPLRPAVPSLEAEALADFVKYAVHYHILGTKYTFTRSPIVLAEIVRALLREAKGMKAEAGLYDLTRRLNLISGTILLDALPRTTLRKLIVDSVEQIMSNVELVSDRRRLSATGAHSGA